MADSGSNNRWVALLRAARAWGCELNTDQLLPRIAKDSAELFEFDFCAIFLLSNEGLLQRAVWPMNADSTGSVALNHAHQVVSTGKPLFGFKVEGQSNDREKARSICCSPLSASRGTLGAIYLHSTEKETDFTRETQEFVETLSLQAAMAIEHATLFHSAITDPLTGLLTHRRFQQEVEHAVRRAARTEQPASLLLLDLDHFKQLNDTCGHAIGNQCLLQVSGVLRDALRTTDVIARFGGDEFEILLPDTPPAAALSVAEKLRGRIAELDFQVKVSGTIGVAGFPDNASDAASLFLNTDAALYEAKEAGRNRCVLSQKRGSSTGQQTSTETRKRRGSETAMRRVTVPQAAPEQNGEVHEQIDGHAILKRLGSGTSGEVLLVKQPELEREVALKRPLVPHVSQEQTLDFEREAKVTASLNHPGVITIHTMGRDVDGRRYYTMRPLEGHSLAHILDRRSTNRDEQLREFSTGRLLEILQRASEAIAYAHRKNVLHLDLTPSNIVVGDFGEVTVIDWASGASSSSRASPRAADSSLRLVLGSPRYVAPEQCVAGSTPTSAADVFALGAILYEVLTNRAPFEGGSSKQTIEGLLRGEVVSPDKVAPDEGIDPMLSELCMKALRRDPAERPSAADFAERLGRYVRREMEWIVTRFGEDGRALREDEWIKPNGNFELIDGEWVTRSGGELEHVVLWKVPVQGSFRFVAEGWLEQDRGELSLLGRRAHDNSIHGYGFHAGAEFNALAKLTRNGNTVFATTAYPLEPKRRYRLEMEYQEQDGWVRCYLDGKRIMAFRELFSFPGSLLGFYSFAHGTHIRPLEVHRQVWGLQAPAMHSADSMFRHGSYEAALERYRELADRLSDRMEGTEARLKVGMCLLKLDRVTEAREILHSLKGTPLESHALGEEAQFEFGQHPLADRRRVVPLMQTLFDKFPDPASRSKINDISSLIFKEGAPPPIELNLQIRRDAAFLSSQSLDPPTSCQIMAGASAADQSLLLGDYGWLRRIIDLKARMRPQQFVLLDPTLNILAMASGCEDLLIYNEYESVAWDFDVRQCPGGLTFQVAVRKGIVQQQLDFCRRINYQFYNDGRRAVLSLMMLNVLAGQQADAARWLKFLCDHFGKGTSILAFAIAEALGGTDNRELFNEFVEFLNKRDDIVATNYATAQCARWEIERLQFDRAARVLHDYDGAPVGFVQDRGSILLIMLHSLGILDTPASRRAVDRYSTSLAGTPLKLAEMFLGKREPVPGEKWPHPHWYPEWRLWLAIWLEAKGRRAEAHAVANPALDPRFGETCSQTALKRLVKRTGP